MRVKSWETVAQKCWWLVRYRAHTPHITPVCVKSWHVRRMCYFSMALAFISPGIFSMAYRNDVRGMSDLLLVT